MSNSMNAPQTPSASEKRPAAPAQTSGAESQEWLSRVGFLVVLAGAIGLTWWSLTRVLAPRQEEARKMGTTVARLSGEVEDLERRWNKAKTARVNERFDAIHAELFGGPLGLETWLANLKEQVVPLSITVQAEFGNASPLATNGQRLVIVPAMLSVDVQSLAPTQGVATPYQRLLLLSQHLAAQEKRADLTELTVMGGPSSINHAVFGLNLWAAEPKPQ